MVRNVQRLLEHAIGSVRSTPLGRRSGHRRWQPPDAALVVVWVLLSAIGLGASSPTSAAPESLEGRARAAATSFFDRYMAPDGRIVRHDQGGDTVSEGQAYALLLAVGIGDQERFDLAWTWTRAHLQRADGLLSWRWGNGRVLDSNAATDADVDAAYALILAAGRFGRPDYRSEGMTIARSVLAEATVEIGGRAPVLVAGSWARDEPYVINPSYFAPKAFAEFASATGDRRWTRLIESSHRLTLQLTASPPGLPPDWAQVDVSGSPTPISSPSNQEGQPRYGFDAARVLVRFAADCAASSRALVRRVGSLLPRTDRVAAVYDLQGRQLVDFEHPLGLIATAAIAFVVGDAEGGRQRLDRAEQLDAQHPTYYGSAWIALGRLMLSTTLLGACAPGAL
jgi:endoglucanase